MGGASQRQGVSNDEAPRCYTDVASHEYELNFHSSQIPRIKSERSDNLAGGNFSHTHTPPPATQFTVGIDPGNVQVRHPPQHPASDSQRSALYAVLQPSGAVPPEAVFSKYVQLFIWSNSAHTPSRVYPVRDFMRQGLQNFLEWYSRESGATVKISVLKLELADTHWQASRAFLVPESERVYFKQLKKLLWDIFWIESSLAGSLRKFMLHISIAAVDATPIVLSGPVNNHEIGTGHAAPATVKNESPTGRRSDIHGILNPAPIPVAN